MGDLFNQRRAAAKRGSSQEQKPGPPSLLDIQAEQERNRGPPSRGSPNRGSHRNDRRGGGGGRGRRDYSNLPVEQGCIASLKDAFGFIYCADRPEEVFFHYSELQGIHSEDLQVDDEMEFRVGPSRDGDKMAAFQVVRLEPGTIEWEVAEEGRFQGLVERPVRSERGSSQVSEGTIRMLVPDEGETTEEEIAAAATGPLIRYSANDYMPEETEGGSNSKEFRRFDSSVSSSSRGGGSSGRGRLGKNDLVEFTLVTERRTGNKVARSITLLQSERERQRLAREKELLANATLEQGIVTSLKTDYGFLRSNRRHEEVYFHYSNVDLPDDDDEEDEEHEHFVLQEGQDMEFLVLTEPGSDSRRDKLSAREVKFLPKGSVVFEKLVAEGVTSVVSRPPHPADAGYASDMVGRVRLTESLEDTDDDGTVKAVDEILFYSKDSPGGTFQANRDGSSVGLWVREGDALLFDVVKDVVDGTLRVAPTKHMQPTVVEDSLEPKAEATDAPAAKDKAVRLMAESLAGRAEGTVHAIKEGYGFITCAERPADAYFRLYELLPDHMQDDLRRNMGIEVGDEIPQLKLGAQVQFDLSLQGIVAIGNHKSRNRLGGSSERENLKGQRLLLLPPNTFMESKVIAKDAKGVVSKEDQKQNYAGFVDFEETYKPMTYEERHPLVAKLIRSILEDESPNQSPVVYHDIQSMQEDDVVVNMVEELGQGSLACTHIPVSSLPGHPGRLCISKVDTTTIGGAADVPSSGGDGSEKPATTAAEQPAGDLVESSTEDEIVQASSHSLGQESSHSKRGKKKKRRPKIKDIASVHYDKHCLAKELMDDIPPGMGDKVLCDIIQSRRTGTVTVANVRVLERSDTERGPVAAENDSSKSAGVGIVTEVVAASKFGFISLLDENATRREMLFFQFSSIVDASPPENSMAASLHSNHSRHDSPVKKGDEVKFDIGVAKKGKRTAINIHIVPRGTLNIPTRAEKNACRGFVLMEPSHTTLKNTPARQASRGTAAKGNSRWDNVEIDRVAKGSSGASASVKEEGRILLINDPANMFAIRTSAKKEEVEPAGSSDADESEHPTEEEPTEETKSIGRKDSTVESAVGTLVSYKNGAIAIHGAGASSVADGSSAPRRGDLVSFVKARSGRAVRDIRVVERGAATLQRGRLEDIKLTPVSESSSPGTAKFIAATEKEEEYDVDLSHVVSCDESILKDKESVEGILHDEKIYGICRTSDLYLGSKLGSGHKERPKLNLTVRKELKKNLGGKIMAQSMMAKGPDGTNGFAAGWTTRVSPYAPPPEEVSEDAPEEEVEETLLQDGGTFSTDGKDDSPKEVVKDEAVPSEQ